MTDARLFAAAELRGFARMLEQPLADPAKIARMMQARANALTPRPAGVVAVLRIEGRTVLVQRRARRAGFALTG
jgi:hypothetical protein